MKKGKIYALICPKEKRIRYVGLTQLTLPQRLNNHWQGLVRAERKGKLFNRKDLWLKSLKDEGLSCEIVLLEECSVEVLGERESYWIKELRNTNELLNFSDGGLTHTEEVRQKISESRVGEKNPNFGKRYKKTPEQIEKQRLAMINSEKFQASRKSSEFRKKVSDRLSRKVCVLNKDYSIYAEFKNSIEAAEHFGFANHSNITNAIKFERVIGKRKSHKGKDFKVKGEFYVSWKDELEETIKKLKLKYD